MYVRVTRTHDSLAFSLVESYRDKQHRPRQRFVKHLGQIPRRSVEDVQARAALWETVNANLAGCSSSTAEKAAAKIGGHVPAPTDAELSQDAKQRRERQYRERLMFETIQAGKSFEEAQRFVRTEMEKPEADRFMWETFTKEET